MRKKQASQLFYSYFEEWIDLYKVGSVRSVTLDKYLMSLRWVRRLAPTLKLADLNKRSYQEMLNGYAMHHEKQTTLDFHHQVKSAILDALDEGVISTNPTRKVVIKGKVPVKTRNKFLNEYDVKKINSSIAT